MHLYKAELDLEVLTMPHFCFDSTKSVLQP